MNEARSRNIRGPWALRLGLYRIVPFLVDPLTISKASIVVVASCVWCLGSFGALLAGGIYGGVFFVSQTPRSQRRAAESAAGDAPNQEDAACLSVTHFVHGRGGTPSLDLENINRTFYSNEP